MTWEEFVHYSTLHQCTYFPGDESVRIDDIESSALVIFYKKGTVDIFGPALLNAQPRYTEFTLTAKASHEIAGAWGKYCETLKAEMDRCNGSGVCSRPIKVEIKS